MKMTKATILKTDGSKEVIFLTNENRLEFLQGIVGGLIEIITIECNVNGISISNDLVINEEGLFLDLPINPFSRIVSMGSIWENEDFRGDMIFIDGVLN